MTTHELAEILLKGPDVEVAIQAPPTGYVSAIKKIKKGRYNAPSWAKDAGDKRPVVILQMAEETLNDDEVIHEEGTL